MIPNLLIVVIIRFRPVIVGLHYRVGQLPGSFFVGDPGGYGVAGR